MTEQLASLAFRNFAQTCRSPQTRHGYTVALHYFMSYLKLEHTEYDKLLDKEPKLIQMDICDYVLHLKEKQLSAATVSMYLAAVRKFYEMNDISQLHWKKIHSFKDEPEKRVEDRPYTHSEIALLIKDTSRRNRAIILLMASAGLRVGAIPTLRYCDLEPVDQYNIYKVTAYAKTRQRYFSFCTPECRSALDQYLEHRRRGGERLTDDSPLFRTDWNPKANDYTVRPISKDRVRNFVNDIARDTGLRGIPLEGITRRFHIMTNHGFRKFFVTNAYRAGMSEMYVERLTGHGNKGINKTRDAYLKLEEQELLEGDSKHIGYIGIIDQLTIAEENRLKKKVYKLEKERGEFDQLRREIDSLKEFMSASRQGAQGP
jgi:integrase